jgi:hypothetical protein
MHVSRAHGRRKAGHTLRDSERKYVIVPPTAIVPARIDQAFTPARYPCSQAASRGMLTFAEEQETTTGDGESPRSGTAFVP